MFETVADPVPWDADPAPGTADEPDWPDWLTEAEHADASPDCVDLSDLAPPCCTPADCRPSGWLALELDSTTADTDRLDDAALVETIVGFDRVASWAQARQTRLLAEFARRRPGDDLSAANSEKPAMIFRYAPDGIAMALRLSRGTAMIRLAQATQLTRQLPATLDAFERGRLDDRKVRAICDAVFHLRPELVTAVEDRVLPGAPEQTLAQLRAALTRAVIAVDPEGAAERHHQARRDRRVAVGDEKDGMASLWALLAAPDATSAYEWLSRLARSLGSEDPRGMDARRADLLVALLTGRLSITPTDEAPADEDPADEDPTSQDPADEASADEAPAGEGPADMDPVDEGPAAAQEPQDVQATQEADQSSTATPAPAGQPDPDSSAPAPTPAAGAPTETNPATPARRNAPAAPGKPLVHIVMPYTTLIGADDEPCELTGFGPIPAHLAREIAADAVWQRLVTDPLSGTLLDYGHTTYRPPPALADYVRARDLTCRSPICRHRALNCELDHALAWTDLGITAETNLWSGCPHDHHLKHDAGWQVSLNPDRTMTWTTPTGHTYTSRPHDYRPDPTPPPQPARPNLTDDPPDDDLPPF